MQGTIYTHFTNSPLDPTKMAVRVTHQREDGMFIIGYVQCYDDNRWFAYTIDDYKLLCDPDDGEPVFFHTVQGAGEALTEPDAYHLIPAAQRAPL